MTEQDAGMNDGNEIGDEENDRAFENDQLDQIEKDEFKSLLTGEFIDPVTEETIVKVSQEIDGFQEKVLNKNPGWRSLYVDFDELCQWIPTLRMKLKISPSKVIRELSGILEEVIEERFGGDFLDHGYFHIRPVPNIPDNDSGFDNIASKMIGKLVNLRGIVTRITRVQPYPKTIKFVCMQCGYVYNLEIKSHSVYYPPPKNCPNAECPGRGRATWDMVIEDSRYVDFQKITIQEEPDYLRSREQPRTVKIVIIDDIVGMIKPGSRVMVSGLLVAKPLFVETRKSWDYSLFDLHVHAFNVQPQDSEEREIEKITDEREREILDFVEKYVNMENGRDLYFKQLIDAVAPMIYGYEMVKQALLCVAVGGQTYIPSKGGRIRGTINILLVGDPGCGKSKMIESVGAIVAIFEYSSGQASTKAGMTAGVIKEDGNMELEAGLVVRADGGVAAIDEFEKVDKNDRSALLEQMEHGRVTVHKYKFHETLNARCGVIGAANPKDGELKPPDEMTIQKQIEDIPLPIQSRFDLIFLIEDIPDPPKDRKIVEKMMESRDPEYAKPLHYVTNNSNETEIQKHVNFVKDLITVAKKRADGHPIGMTDAAKKVLMEFYLKIRADSFDPDTQRKRRDLPTPITPRQFEATHRISTALAKLTFSKMVDVDHVNRAILMVNESMKQVMTDEDGNMDASMASTGKSKAQIDKIDLLLRVLHAMDAENSKEKGVGLKEFKKKILDETKIGEKKFQTTLDKLLRERLVKELQGNKVRITSDGRLKLGL